MDENPSTAWTGTCGFRMLPTDDFAQGPSTARLTEVAGGAALALDYTWVHPEQGEQAGHLVLGRPDDGGRVTVAFTDSFHQSPEIRVPEGSAARTEGGGDAGRDRGAGAAPHPIDGDGVAVTMFPCRSITSICTVSPGFDFAGFEMAPPDWHPRPRGA